jgi:predicted AAA+ superfamily ATPase
MEQLIGRVQEKAILLEALQSNDSELIAIYGRRRVGKTFLIRSVYEHVLSFELSGIHTGSLAQQLQNFSLSLGTSLGLKVGLVVPENWLEAFHILQTHLSSRSGKEKHVLFFDEFPWLHSARSGFLPAFEHFWNTWASRQSDIIVVVCGSAASWMIKNVVRNRGGLHNRLTRRIRLLPFTLQETEVYLQSRHVNLQRYQILQVYMAMGGVPQYLKAIKPGESATQSIDRLCFSKNSFLKEEFTNLFQSLFDHASHHMAIVRALAEHGKGLTRNELIKNCGLSSGGTASKLLDELTESGFIYPYIPLFKTEKDAIYKLSDEYTLFYLKFIEKTRTAGTDVWLRLSDSAAWKSWSGLAYERICLKHVPAIKRKLGIQGVHTDESIWRNVPKNNSPGAQIDLLIDRQDQCINVCEIKFSQSEFVIEKSYMEALQQKLMVFREKTSTKKTLFLTLITTFGIKRNIYSPGLVQQEITMDDLFS